MSTKRVLKKWGVDWIQFASGEGPVAGPGEWRNEPSVVIKGWEFLQSLSDC
jgi:hypothetical protein